MPDFNNISDVQQLLKDAQEAEYDEREKSREVINFLDKADGQWEPSVIQRMRGRPRYTFDKCNPIVDSIAGEMEQAEFAIKTRPMAGEASKEVSDLYDGLIRNIQNISNAGQIYDSAGRKMIKSGFDAWEVANDWIDEDSFEQDLFIKKISNAIDRVWHDTNSELQDRSDSNWCFVLQALTKEAYKEKFPEGSGSSVDEAKSSDYYTYKAEHIIVGRFLYRKPVEREIVLMSNNAVYDVDDKFESVVDELAAKGITEVRRRKRTKHIVHSRLFDGGRWLSEEKETVFSKIPIVPIYGNFDVTENKITFRGAIDQLMDSQRVYNYAQSRATEEGALAPRAKYWMTKKQSSGHEKQLQTMNTNADPVQFYNHIDGESPPYWTGGAQINQGLQQTAVDMKQNITEGSGIFAANQGDAPNQSGYAIELQQNKGDNSTIKYFKAREIAQCYTAALLIDAIPKVYDTKRTIRILGEDGASKMVTINDEVLDGQTQEIVKLNDLSQGKYDVTCEVGPAFKNRQQETARAFLDMMNVDPSVIQQGKDIWLNNLNFAGADALAERARKQMFEAGLIPDEQMTEEEKQRAQQMIADAQANPPQPSPMDMAMMEQTQANTADINSKAQERMDKTLLANRKQQLEEAKFEQESANETQKLIIQQQAAIVEALNKQADTLKVLREAAGADAIISRKGAENYEDQQEIVDEAQQQQQ